MPITTINGIEQSPGEDYYTEGSPEVITFDATAITGVVNSVWLSFTTFDIDLFDEIDAYFFNGTALGVLSGADQAFQDQGIDVTSLFIPGAINTFTAYNISDPEFWSFDVTDAKLDVDVTAVPVPDAGIGLMPMLVVGLLASRVLRRKTAA